MPTDADAQHHYDDHDDEAMVLLMMKDAVNRNSNGTTKGLMKVAGKDNTDLQQHQHQRNSSMMSQNDRNGSNRGSGSGNPSSSSSAVAASASAASASASAQQQPIRTMTLNLHNALLSATCSDDVDAMLRNLSAGSGSDDVDDGEDDGEDEALSSLRNLSNDDDGDARLSSREDDDDDDDDTGGIVVGNSNGEGDVDDDDIDEDLDIVVGTFGSSTTSSGSSSSSSSSSSTAGTDDDDLISPHSGDTNAGNGSNAGHFGNTCVVNIPDDENEAVDDLISPHSGDTNANSNGDGNGNGNSSDVNIPDDENEADNQDQHDNCDDELMGSIGGGYVSSPTVSSLFGGDSSRGTAGIGGLGGGGLSGDADDDGSGDCDDEEPPLDPGLVAACKHVESLLEQVMVKDAPPMNERQQLQLQNECHNSSNAAAAGAASGTGSAITMPTSPVSSSDVVNGGTAAASSSFDTDSSSLGGLGGLSRRDIIDGALMQNKDGDRHHRHRNNCGEKKSSSATTTHPSQSDTAAIRMGHASLAALCSWTLEQVRGKPVSTPTQQVIMQHTMPSPSPATSQNDKGAGTAAAAGVGGTQPQAAAAAATGKQVTSKSSKPMGIIKPKRILPWKKHHHGSADAEEKKDDASSSDFGATEGIAAGGTPSGMAAATGGGKDPNQQQKQQPRLQQFASEYARHLSKSSLAPQQQQQQQQQKDPPPTPAAASVPASPHTSSLLSGGSVSSNKNSGKRFVYGRTSSQNHSSKSSAIPLLEDADTSVLTGALLDICITFGENEPPPRGYHRISQTASGRPVPQRCSSSSSSSLPGGGGGGGSSKRQLQQRWYLNVKKETNWDKAAQRPTITAICVIFPDRGEFVPPGFCVVKTPAKVPANLNENLSGNSSNQQGGERCYLVFRRSRECNPLTGLVPLVPPESVPPGYTVVERTPRNHVANLYSQQGSKGGGSSSSPSSQMPPLFLAYRQRLAHLEALRPLPLVKAAQPNLPGADFLNDDESSSSLSQQAAKLMAYYATGGTTVRSNVGRFHILDRSTHSLLSPSSVANRLALIQLSRRNGKQSSGGGSTSSGNGNLYMDDTLHGSSSSIGGGDSNHNGDDFGMSTAPSALAVAARHEYHSSSNLRSGLGKLEPPRQIPIYILSHFLKSSLLPSDEDDHHIMSYHNDASLHLSLEAMAFIPAVEAAVSTPQSSSSQQQHFRLQARSALLTPILTACYSRHGGAALVAVEALTDLLTSTDFFQDDADLQTDDHESSRRFTLLDLSLQTVCDVATSSASETCFSHCVDFVQHAVQFTEGKLHTRTIGYVVRFYLFVFYFGASVPCQSSQRWPNPNWSFSKPNRNPNYEEYGDPTMASGTKYLDDNECRLLDDPRTDGRSYLPGGAPQAAALALKELISLSIVRLGKVSVSGMAEMAEQEQEGHNTSSITNGSIRQRQQESQDAPMSTFLEGIVSSLIDDAVDHVERANYTQLAYYQIHRSGGSELFWHDMVNTCGMGLFKESEYFGAAGRDIYIMIFAVLANLVKVASGKMRPNNKSDRSALLSRDTASKLLSLELILLFLEFWSDEQEAVHGVLTTSTKTNAIDRQSVDTLAFTIRRMVVPSLLSNTRCGLEDPQVFTRIIRILSELWCSPVYRHHLKVELGILIEHFGLRMLQLGPQLVASKSLDLWSDRAQVSLLAQQVEVIKEMKNWFSNDPKDVIELFLNYDTDMCSEITGPIQLMPGTQWQIFQRLCAGLSNIAEQCGELIGKQIQENQSKVMHTKDRVIGAAGLSALLEAMNEGSKGAVDETAVREAARLLRKTSLETISQIVMSLAISAATSAGNEFSSLLLSWTPADVPVFSTSASGSSNTANKKSPDAAQAPRRQTPLGSDDEVLRFWRDAIASDQQERLSNAVPSSQESRQVALEIAKRKSLKKAIEYLIACNALSPSPRDIANFLRINKESLDPTALGNYLSESGTGSGAETEYWNSIRHLYVRAISFVGQTLEEGLRHFLTCCGFRLPGEAQRVDRIMTTFAKCYYEDNAGDSQRCPFKHEDTVYLLSFAIIMLNTDLHKSASSQSRPPRKKMNKTEFINNLRGAEQGEEISREYLFMLYDSIEANPIELHPVDASESGSKTEERARALQDMLNNVRSADSLLRGLAVHDFHFATIDDFVSGLDYDVENALGDLSRSCVSKTWHQWHGVINTGLETAHLDPTGMEPCVDILLYALCIAVCLDMPTERAAFLSQLGRLKAFEERRQGRWVSATEHDSYKEESWYLEIEKACTGPTDRKVWALRKIHHYLTGSLKSALKVDVQNKVSMSSIVRQIKDGDYLLQDPSRSFLRAAQLLKKSSRTGRSTSYRFILFSDVLMYASEESGGKFRIHEELPLHLMKVIDWFPPSQKNRKLVFEISHPRKSFFVICSSAKERKSWVQQIKVAITLEMDRKMKVEAARMAAYTGT